MPNNYNYIYDQLVGEDKDNLAGIIAYSVYKRHKIEFIKEHGDSNLPIFQNISQSPTQIEFYKNEAAEILQNFAVAFLEEDLNERERFFKAEVAREVNAKSPRFMTGVYQSIIGSYGFICSLGIMLFIVWSSKVGLKQIIELIFNVKIVDI